MNTKTPSVRDCRNSARVPYIIQSFGWRANTNVPCGSLILTFFLPPALHRNQPLCSCTLSDSHLFTQRSLQHQSILAITSICHHTIIGLKIDGTPGTGANAHEAARRQRRARAPFRANHMWHAVAQFFRARHAARVDDGHKAWPEG